MAVIAWQTSPASGDYNSVGNWSPTVAVPSSLDAASFSISTITSLFGNGVTDQVGEWIFNPGAYQYSFANGISNLLEFVGAGIVINGGGITIVNSSFGFCEFYNFSSAGNAAFVNSHVIEFHDFSTTGNATISNLHILEYFDYASAGNAVIVNDDVTEFDDFSTASSASIHTMGGGQLVFVGFSSGGNAQLITDAGGTVDFSASAGPAGDHRLTVGSIAGAGTYHLGAGQLTVLGNGPPAIVSGPVDDGGLGHGTGASLVKRGHGALTLSGAGNTYSGGTTLEGGVLDLAAIGAAGTGPIPFNGRARLKIENAALSHHVFGNPIDQFARHDILDLTGLHFHVGATATYHGAHHRLIVHSGNVTDKLTLFSPHGTSFAAANDGHGGTKVILDPPPIAATMASLHTHDVIGQDWANQIDGGNHTDGFLFAT
jgi:autotransporter-associated beta strand protein